MFPFFNHYPGTGLHEIDLAYLLTLAARLEADDKTLLAWKKGHETEYKDLLDKVNGLIDNLIDVIVPWDSSVAYHIFSIVEYQGTNYIAVQDVPVGVMITDTDYWQPANTVIEQLNAIAVTVSDMDRTYNTAADLEAATGLDVGMTVRTLGYFRTGDGNGYTYKIREKEEDEVTNGYLIETDGKIAEPVDFFHYDGDKLSDGMIYAMMKIAISYYDDARFNYGSSTTTPNRGASLFDQEITRTVDGVTYFGCDCSSYACSILLGIILENSRYIRGVNSTNVQDRWGYIFDDNFTRQGVGRTNGMYVTDMAQYAASHGLIYKINDDGSNVLPGDFLFEVADLDLSPIYRDSFMNIGHVVWVYDVVSRDTKWVRVFQCGGSGTDEIDENTGTRYILIPSAGAMRMSEINLGRSDRRTNYGVRFHMPRLLSAPIEMSYSENATYPVNFTNITSGQTLVQMNLREPLEQGEVYTILMKGDLPTYDRNRAYPTVRAYATSVSAGYTICTMSTLSNTSGKYWHFVFTPRKDSSVGDNQAHTPIPDKTIDRLTINILKTDTQPLTGVLEGAVLIKGYYGGTYDDYIREKTASNTTKEAIATDVPKMTLKRTSSGIWSGNAATTGETNNYNSSVNATDMLMVTCGVNGTGANNGTVIFMTLANGDNHNIALPDGKTLNVSFGNTSFTVNYSDATYGVRSITMLHVS